MKIKSGSMQGNTRTLGFVPPLKPATPVVRCPRRSEIRSINSCSESWKKRGSASPRKPIEHIDSPPQPRHSAACRRQSPRLTHFDDLEDKLRTTRGSTNDSLTMNAGSASGSVPPVTRTLTVAGKTVNGSATGPGEVMYANRDLRTGSSSSKSPLTSFEPRKTESWRQVSPELDG